MQAVVAVILDCVGVDDAQVGVAVPRVGLVRIVGVRFAVGKAAHTPRRRVRARRRDGGAKGIEAGVRVAVDDVAATAVARGIVQITPRVVRGVGRPWGVGILCARWRRGDLAVATHRIEAALARVPVGDTVGYAGHASRRSVAEVVGSGGDIAGPRIRGAFVHAVVGAAGRRGRSAVVHVGIVTVPRRCRGSGVVSVAPAADGGALRGVRIGNGGLAPPRATGRRGRGRVLLSR